MVKIGKDIIFMYSENARVKIKELAALLNKSSQRIKYSLKALEKEGIVYNPYCIFDYSYFGMLLFRVYFKGAFISEKDKAEIIKKLTENDYITSVYELSGEFELVVEIQAPNPSRFNKVLKKISALIPTLRHYKIILNIVTHLYPPLYLTDNDALYASVPLQVIIGGDRDVESFDSNEIVIMKKLLDNPKLRMTSLAKQSGINVKTAKAAMQNLRKRNIIKGFKFVTNAGKLGVHKFRLFLNLHNLSREREEELMNYLLKINEVVQVHKTVGDWDLEIDIESLDKTKIRQITLDMRENFKDIIETFNIMEFYNHYKKSYLPQYYFEQSISNKNKNL